MCAASVAKCCTKCKVCSGWCLSHKQSVESVALVLDEVCSGWRAKCLSVAKCCTKCCTARSVAGGEQSV